MPTRTHAAFLSEAISEAFKAQIVEQQTASLDPTKRGHNLSEAEPLSVIGEKRHVF